ncbi:hypothetical protein [Actinoplanes sp. L3-i22]|uniref:hypothetical protein n=1 Tax=Actinoplanes sp. L3-i22 TaxID=2836373 RepID=UPI001C74850F|nr:hypothetical protein [Actinoplanes sp. L3-i22]BCY13512.1 hypothetical protein L3i22_086000 [Actinoplanes sp. L3-i22]
MDAELAWDLNDSLFVGPWAVRVSADGTHATLADPGTLADLREIHGWDPVFTLRHPDGTRRPVLLGRPADDGTFLVTDLGT